MKSLFHITSAKKFVVPSVAVMMTLASTMFMAPVFAVGFFHMDTRLETNSDGSITAIYVARGFSSETSPGAKVFLTSDVDVEFKCTNPNAQGKDQPQAQSRETTIELKSESDNFDMGAGEGEVSIGPPTSDDLCPTDQLTAEVESITYTDIVLHAIPNGSSQPEVTHEFEDVGPITP